MTARTVDLLLDERARLVAQKTEVEGSLWAAEFLLLRISKLLPHLIADSPHNAVARDTIAQEIRELLAEPRHHPGPTLGGADLQGEGSEAPSSVTLADEVAAGLHDEPSP